MSARIFLSYARSDGGAAAEALMRFLEDHGHSAWQDLRQLGPDETVWPQIERALRDAEFLLVLVTPAALTSAYIRKEWREARRNGATIIPVRALEQSRSTLPRWLRRGEIHDLGEPAHREKFLARLNSTGGTFRADWDDGLRIETFVARPRLFNDIKAWLLSETSDPVSLTSALHGRGGYGKSVLAGEIARDPEIRDAYIDGVFWVSLGHENPDVLGQLNHLIRRISGASGAPDVNVAAEELRRLLDKRDVLIILDDVWRRQDLAPFAAATGHGAATLLATTRKLDALPLSVSIVDVSGMDPQEAVDLLSFGLTPDAGERAALADFAAAFWHWPQLLAIANGLLRRRVRDGDTLERALATIMNGARQGVVPGDDERDRTIANVMQMGIDDLPEPGRTRFRSLAILPEDTAVPVAILAPLWGMGTYETWYFASVLLDRRLIQSCDLSDPDVGARIRLHDDMLWYLGHSAGAEAKRSQHAALLAAHWPESGSWTDLDRTVPALRYLWRHLLWHLDQAGEQATANSLRVAWGWIEAKLKVVGIETLLADYRPRPSDPTAALAGNALALSRQVLDGDPAKLGWQIHGRLAQLGQPALADLCMAAEQAIALLTPVALRLDPPGAQLMRLVGHKSPVHSVAFSPDGRRIASGGHDGTLRLWDVTTGAALGEPLRGHERVVSSVAYSPDGRRIVSGGHDGTLRLSEVTTGAALGEPLRGHESWVRSVAFSPDGRRIASGGHDGTLRLWDATTGAALGEPLRGHELMVDSVAFSPDSRRIASGGADGTLRLWDVTTGAALGEPPRRHKSGVRSVAFSPDGRRIVSGRYDGTLRFWDATTGATLGEPLRGHELMVDSVAFSPDGRRIVSGGDDGTLRLWDATTGAALGGPLRGHVGQVYSVAFSPDGRCIVSGGYDGTLRLWDATTGATLGASLRGHEFKVTSVALSPDDRRVVSGGEDGTLRLWDVTTGAALGEPLRGHVLMVNSVAFSPDSRRIVSGGEDGTLRLWDATTGAAIGGPLRGHKSGVRSVAFSPDGRRIVSGGEDGTLRLWDATTGAAIGEPLRGHEGWVYSVAFSPDGRRIVGGSSDGTLHHWDATTGAALGGPLRGPEGWFRSVAFSPDGSCIATGGQDGTLHLWDVTTGAALGEPLRGHEGEVNSVAFSSDGRRIVSGGDDGTLRLWDITSRALQQTFPIDAAISAVAASHSHLALGDTLGHVHILRWRTSP